MRTRQPAPIPPDPILLTLSVPRIVSWLLGCIASLGMGHVVVHGVFALTEHRLFGLHRLLDLNNETSVGTLFSVLLLAATSGLLAWVAFSQRNADVPFRTHVLPWILLAAGFAFMVVDEGAQVHDAIVQGALSTRIERGSGIFYSYWYFVYAPLVGLIAALYVPFLRRIPRRTAIRFVVAGVVYVGGVIGIEALTAAWLEGQDGFTMNLLELAEEGAEMLGVALMIRALLLHLAASGTRLNVSVAARDAEPPPTR